MVLHGTFAHLSLYKLLAHSLSWLCQACVMLGIVHSTSVFMMRFTHNRRQVELQASSRIHGSYAQLKSLFASNAWVMSSTYHAYGMVHGALVCLHKDAFTA